MIVRSLVDTLTGGATVKLPVARPTVYKTLEPKTMHVEVRWYQMLSGVFPGGEGKSLLINSNILEQLIS